MDSTTNTAESQESAPKWTQWDIERAWLDVVDAREKGHRDAEALAMRRFSEGLRNSAIGAAGAVLGHLDEKIDKLAGSFDAVVRNQTFIQTEVESRADYFYRRFGDFLKDADARFNGYAASEQTTLQALTSVAHRLDEITSYVQQSVTIAREALSVAKAGAARLGKITKDVTILKKAMVDSQIDRADLRQRIDAISMSQAVFAASMLLSAHAVIVIDPKQVIASVNHKALAYFGYTDGELIGQPLDILIPERFRAAHRKHIRAFAQSSDTERLMSDRHTVYGLHKDGSEFPIRAAIVKVSNGFTAVVERVDDAQ